MTRLIWKSVYVTSNSEKNGLKERRGETELSTVWTPHPTSEEDGCRRERWEIEFDEKGGYLESVTIETKPQRKDLLDLTVSWRESSAGKRRKRKEKKGEKFSGTEMR